ncbi:MAG: hypothetical protein C0412_16915 [Flavobacterium sp.]|nr:hypothetical protein [Flavobacterium sp.]
MSSKCWKGVFIFGLVVLIASGCKNNDAYYKNEIGDSSIPVNENAIERIAPLCFPDTANGKSDFNYRWHKLELAEGGKIFIADGSSSSILVLNPSDGKIERSIGGKGKGPGEFQTITNLIYEPKKGLIAIDNMQSRVTIFDTGGKVIKILESDFCTDDVEFLGDKIFYSSYEARSDYKTIKAVSDSANTIIARFGPILEPKKDFFEKVSKAKRKSGFLGMFSHMAMTGLIYIKEENALIFSQKYPYAIWKIDLDGYKAERFNKKVDFSTYSNNDFTETDNSATYSSGKSGVMLHPVRIGNKIIAAIFDQENQKNYLDVYNIKGDFVERLKIPSLGKNYWIFDFKINELNNTLYLLVADEDRISWIERFKINKKL